MEQPHFVDMFPDAAVRERALPHAFSAVLADAARHGHIDLAHLDGRLAGAAIWYPPHRYPLSPGRQLRTLPAGLRMAFVAPRSVRRVMQFQLHAARLHPTQPYWYLAAIGVEPSLQGSGVGTRLLSHRLELLDGRGEAAYLETHTRRAVGWYGSAGFRVRESEVAFTPGGPPNWTMWRPGRPT